MRNFIGAAVFTIVVHGLYFFGSYVYEQYAEFVVEREIQSMYQASNSIGVVTWEIPGTEPDYSLCLITVPAFYLGYLFVKRLRRS